MKRMIVSGFAWFVVAASEAFAGGGKATLLVNVADTRKMEPGIGKWIADVYNSNLLHFGLLVVVVMVTMGCVLGFAFDKALGLLGIKLGKLSHHE